MTSTVFQIIRLYIILYSIFFFFVEMYWSSSEAIKNVQLLISLKHSGEIP